MSKDKLHISDMVFSHAKSSSWYNEPELFDWVRDVNPDCMVYTDFSLFNIPQFIKRKYAWLVESPEITKNSYTFIEHNYDIFDKIFTFDRHLLSLSNKFELVPIGGCWINKNDRYIHDKSKLISIILSSKRLTEGHRLRHQVIDEIQGLDIYGYNNPIDEKITALKDYRFSIVIENVKSDYYFTEKLIDTFMTGTIPIYWGCPSIGDFFDTNGILTFDTVSDLKDIINNLTIDLYQSKTRSIINNFELAKKYLVADDIIYNKIKND